MGQIATSSTDCIVIGAGLSGLSIASQLHARGISYHLLEARDRLGGRILSLDGFDFGPAWFWPWHGRMRKLVTDLGLEYYEQQDEGLGLFQHAGGIQQLPSGYTGVSYRVVGGLGEIVEGLASNLDQASIHLGAHASELSISELSSDEVRVVYEQNGAEKEIFGRRVFLAVPPRVVARRIKFTPGLPKQLMDEMANLPTWMVGHAKVVVRYDSPFWRERGLSGTAFSLYFT